MKTNHKNALLLALLLSGCATTSNQPSDNQNNGQLKPPPVDTSDMVALKPPPVDTSDIVPITTDKPVVKPPIIRGKPPVFNAGETADVRQLAGRWYLHKQLANDEEIWGRTMPGSRRFVAQMEFNPPNTFRTKVLHPSDAHYISTGYFAMQGNVVNADYKETHYQTAQGQVDVSFSVESIGNQQMRIKRIPIMAVRVLPAPVPRSYLLSERSRIAMAGVNPKLVAVIKTAMRLSPVPFAVTEGHRSAARQAYLRKAGLSWVKVSRHQQGNAVDVAAFPGNSAKASWDMKYYALINRAVQQAAKQHGVRVIWGGYWKQRDGVHFELDVRDVGNTAGYTLATL